MAMIKLKNIVKKYDDKVVFDNFNLEIEKGKILVILGESGSGKTTLLNILSNLTDYLGEVIDNLSPVSYVFQNDRLIKNMTVKENLRLIYDGVDLTAELEKMGIENAKDLYPKELSAGMSRRVNLLRAILKDAPLMLLDEPTINLDLKNKYSILKILKERQYKAKNTLVFVTHDIEEALLVADRIVVLSNGKITLDKDNVSEKDRDIIIQAILK